MKLTIQLKNWLSANKGVDESASDETFRKALGEALANDELSTTKFQELLKESEPEGLSLLKQLTSNIAELTKKLTEPEVKTTEKAEKKEEDKAKEMPCPKCGGKMVEGQCTKCDYAAKEEGKSSTPETKSVDGGKPEKPKGEKKMSNLEKIFVGMAGHSELDEEKTFSIRVKEAADQYDDTKSALHYPAMMKGGQPHPYAGKPVRDFSESEVSSGRVLHSASDLGKAVAGAWGKFIVGRQRFGTKRASFDMLTSHDRELLYYAFENERWGGSSDGGDYADIKDRRLTPHEQKALIDDSISGGLEAAPIVFDDMIIQTPLLHSELFPLVNVVPLDRGRRIEGVAVSNVTANWGGVDDTAIDLFNTASYVTAFNTTVFRWEGAIRIGLDFMSDTPIDFAQIITTQYGERLLEDLDDVIAVGNGSTQPEGIMNKSGTTSVSFGGTTSIGNYESLRFGVSKAEHRTTVKSTAVFCGTEESYQRVMALPVGASDARRLFGKNLTVGGTESYDDYSIMSRPYKINESMSNQQLFYAVLARYRMYRRRGLTVRSSREGDTLIRRNEELIAVTARWGGQLERGACAAVTSDAPA